MSTHTISVCHSSEDSVCNITCVGELLWYQVLNAENKALELILKSLAFGKNDQSFSEHKNLLRKLSVSKENVHAQMLSDALLCGE